jgi:hypothetical protein
VPRLKAEDLKWRVSKLGVTIGSPWRTDEKLCVLAFWLNFEN